MQARADAIDELTEAGALEDFTSLGDDIDRQLKQIQQSGQVDDELAKLKAELGRADEPKEIERRRTPTRQPTPADEPARRDAAAKPRRAARTERRPRPRSDRRVEQRQPARQILLDRKLLLELRLQLELGRVVALLALAGRDERPEGAALEAVDPVDGVLAALEAERRREELRAEALRGQLAARPRARTVTWSSRSGSWTISHSKPYVSVFRSISEPGRAAGRLDQRLDVVVDPGEVAATRAA